MATVNLMRNTTRFILEKSGTPMVHAALEIDHLRSAVSGHITCWRAIHLRGKVPEDWYLPKQV